MKKTSAIVLISISFFISSKAVAADSQSDAKAAARKQSVFSIENICSAESGFVLYPGPMYRSFIEKEYMHSTFDDLLMAVLKLPSNTKIVFGCSKGLSQFADSQEIEKRTEALRKTCSKARVECVAQPVAPAYPSAPGR